MIVGLTKRKPFRIFCLTKNFYAHYDGTEKAMFMMILIGDYPILDDDGGRI